MNDNKFVTDQREPQKKEEQTRDFGALMAEFNEMIEKLQVASGGEFATKWAPRIADTITKYLGKGKRISDCTPDQAGIVELIVDDLKDQLGNGI